MPKIFALTFLIIFNRGLRRWKSNGTARTAGARKIRAFFVICNFSKRNCVLKGLKFFRDPKKFSRRGAINAG